METLPVTLNYIHVGVYGYILQEPAKQINERQMYNRIQLNYYS